MPTHCPTMQEVQNENNRAALVALGLIGWALINSEQAPSYIGDMMALIGKKLGVFPSAKNLNELADEILSEP